MMTRLVFGIVLAAVALAGAGRPALAQAKLDPTPRTAVISAFQPESVNLAAELRDRHDEIVHGIDFATVTIEVSQCLFLSGMSMVNASLSTQMALDRFAPASSSLALRAARTRSLPSATSLSPCNGVNIWKTPMRARLLPATRCHRPIVASPAASAAKSLAALPPGVFCRLVSNFAVAR
jgi:hypothetical protein